MKGDLIDTEGYPRSDIDVYSVRHARHKIICTYELIHSFKLHVYSQSQLQWYFVFSSRHSAFSLYMRVFKLTLGLQNDHKDVMRQIEEKLYAVHEFARKTKSASTAEDNCSSAVRSKSELVGFLLVDQVATGGPAEQAVSKLSQPNIIFIIYSFNLFRSRPLLKFLEKFSLMLSRLCVSPSIA